jgi:AraC family transcriptional activator of pobA
VPGVSFVNRQGVKHPSRKSVSCSRPGLGDPGVVAVQSHVREALPPLPGRAARARRDSLLDMTSVRPFRRDDLRGGGSPVFVTRQSHECEGSRPTPTTHQYAALAFCTSGRARIEQQGLWALEPGDVFLVPAGQPHRSIEVAHRELWGLGFCVPCFASDDGGALLEPFERVRDGASPVVHVPSERHSFLEALFGELEDATSKRQPSTPEAVQRSLLTLILNEVRRAGHWNHDTAKPSGVVVDSLRFIERNCLRRLTLNDVAEAVGRSPAYVTTALTRATGRSAVEWIIGGRMAEARRRLLHSDERVDIVAERVGYADPTHFIRMFRREHGATPAAWRAKSSSQTVD